MNNKPGWKGDLVCLNPLADKAEQLLASPLRKETMRFRLCFHFPKGGYFHVSSVLEFIRMGNC